MAIFGWCIGKNYHSGCIGKLLSFDVVCECACHSANKVAGTSS